MNIVCIDMYDEYEKKISNYGIDSNYIQNILKKPIIDTIDNVHMLYGVYINDNVMIPIISLKEYLGIGMQDSTDNVILLKYNRFTIGVIIDKLDNVISINTDAKNIDIKESVKDKFIGIAEYKDSFLNILSVERLFATLEINEANIAFLESKIVENNDAQC